MTDLKDLLEVTDKSDNTPNKTPLIDLDSPLIKEIFPILLKDKTTKKNIIWATDAYLKYGPDCSESSHICIESFFSNHPIPLHPRIMKTVDAQQNRTRSKGEVFTPVWICNRMINWEDQEWFGRPDVFNIENPDGTWIASDRQIEFPEGRTWMSYVDSRRLEITCGEAPFLVSRYDVSTGKLIESPFDRIGILDRKLRIVSENTSNEDDWIKWAIRALQSCYGYEWQGDNLLIARINVFITFCEYYSLMWSKDPSKQLIKTVANTIAWNIWQMDGLKDTIPFGKPYKTYVQRTLFDDFQTKPESKEDVAFPSIIHDWRRDNSLRFDECKSRGKMKNKMFDFVIGNPPYQEKNENNGRQPPVYHYFMESAYKLSQIVELITPARFLFEAGQTPTQWNQKMLNDPHFKVLQFEKNASTIFPNTDIKGGVAITYYNDSARYCPIIVFTQYPLLNNILKKIIATSCCSISSIISPRGCYRFSKCFYNDYPDAKTIAKNGTSNMVVSNIFDTIPKAFCDTPLTQEQYVKIMGRTNNKRCTKYILRKYLEDNEYLDTFNVLLTESNNDGTFGETLTPTIIANPNEGATDTFISIGTFNTIEEAINLSKYIKTKFSRALLGVKKVTQHNSKSVWIYVPEPNFTPNSDIDWSKSIHEIDLQLYRKYNLSTEEIEFIEKNVQEMN